MADDPVIAALQAAMTANPHPDLHLAIGDRWLALGEAAAALECYQAILSESPAHMVALEKAALAADGAGQSGKATAYRRLYSALGGSIPVSPGPTRVDVFQLEPPPAAGAGQAWGGASDDPLGGGGPKRTPEPVDGPAPEPVEPPVLRLLPGAESDGDGPRLTFDDVGGLQDVKKRIELAFLAPLRQPELFRAYGKSIRGGLLLYGPPGCGKTHIARATAGEVGARFTSIGLIDVLDMWIGESEKRLHEIFETARRQAPVVLFLDELDALGQKRSQLRHRAGRNLVNQLLSEMDGMDTSSGVYMLAATNHPWDVDPALKRPGRFDRTVLVPPPDRPARKVIMERYMRERPMEALDFKLLAQKTDRLSGADLIHLCDTAIDCVLDAALQGKGMRTVQMADFFSALKEVKPSIGPWVEIARNYALYANEGGAYDELAAWLKTYR